MPLTHADRTVTPRRLKTAGAVTGALLGFWLLLSIPGAEPPVAPAPERGRGFLWNQDSLWRSLETTYVHTRAAGCGPADRAAAIRLSTLAATGEQLLHVAVPSGAVALDSVERRFFALAPLVAACSHHLRDYVRLAGRLREAIKWQSRRWDVASDGARARLYRSLYGFRGAVEEAMLQHPDSDLSLLEGRPEPSATPATNVHGVEIHSGDILVSRGGYPTSALIARGNDYPGNFSHVGLVHVDSVTHTASVIEAHIDRGVAVSTADGYLRDKKLRIMVLRLRADLAPLIADPSLPHRAASLALERARSGHIAYDFDMDYTDPSRLFCSEVASSVYGELGVRLWMGLSTISGVALRRWLSAFGVRHFETQEPSDLEYDPQLVVVAEWRDARALMQDHIDNAAIDAMLEGAEAGDALSYPWYQLPLARLAKAYSWVLGGLGGQGPVPQGMSARAALRNKAFSDRQRWVAARVTEAAARWTRQQGYPPPYWVLLDLARTATGPLRPAGLPAQL
jgi:Permuted papain-like amidase enzyme, YaeF/YiiX, C92 family